jgi:hypothetical protein
MDPKEPNRNNSTSGPDGRDFSKMEIDELKKLLKQKLDLLKPHRAAQSGFTEKDPFGLTALRERDIEDMIHLLPYDPRVNPIGMDYYVTRLYELLDKIQADWASAKSSKDAPPPASLFSSYYIDMADPEPTVQDIKNILAILYFQNREEYVKEFELLKRQIPTADCDPPQFDPDPDGEVDESWYYDSEDDSSDETNETNSELKHTEHIVLDAGDSDEVDET